jgi:EthD domain
MLRLFALGRRNNSLTRPEYHDSLLHRHAPLVGACESFQRFCRRYHQNHVMGPIDAGAADELLQVQARFDNCSEFWFDDLDALLKTFNHPSYLATVRPDEPNWTDGKTRVAFLAEETEISTGRHGHATTKLLALVPGTSRVLDPGTLALPSIPGCVRQIENRVLGQLDFQKGQLAETASLLPFVHLSELWFESSPHMRDWLAAGGAEALQPGASLDRIALWANEHVIF